VSARFAVASQGAANFIRPDAGMAAVRDHAGSCGRPKIATVLDVVVAPALRRRSAAPGFIATPSPRRSSPEALADLWVGHTDVSGRLLLRPAASAGRTSAPRIMPCHGAMPPRSFWPTRCSLVLHPRVALHRVADGNSLRLVHRLGPRCDSARP